MNTKTVQYILSALLSLFSVLFLWGFFELGSSALGINFTIFGIIFFILYLLLIDNKKEFILKYKYWILPFAIIILSYSLYEIPFLKALNIWLLPILVFFFFGYSIVKKEDNHQWYLALIPKLIFRALPVKKSVQELNQHMDSGSGKNTILYKKIIIGVIILIAINLVIVGLLMVADTNFKDFILEFGKYINRITVLKLLVSVPLFIFFISLLGLWKIDTIIKAREDKTQIDSVIGGIVLGGTLFTYIMFIIIQIDTLFFQSNIDVIEIASLAKNGFWQLFLVSLINIVFFFVYYKKTHNYIQKLLGIFVFTSLIILFSAAERMYTYTSAYGLSYEKFFASYTIIYFAILFILMMWFIIFKKKNDILKTTLVLALWMYSAIHMLPMETFIFRVNTHILQQEGTKIQKYQSHMLSVDILNNVDKIKDNNLYRDESWKEWTDKKIKKSLKKKWYEKNLQDFRIQK